MHEFEKIRSVIIRGGTSKGVFIMKNELPTDPVVRDAVISSMFGGADDRQIDGLGGANSLTSKVAIISVSRREDADVDYTFGQVDVKTGVVDYNSNCGNILSGVGPFAIDEGLVEITEPVTRVRIYNTNTDKVIHAEVPVQNGKAAITGDYAIDGVPGTGAKITLDFIDAAGSKTGELFPTGQRKEFMALGDYGDIEVSIVDVAAPAVFVRAESLGLTGRELSHELSDEHLEVLERIRGTAAERLGFVDDPTEAVAKTPSSPKVIMVAKSMDYTSEAGVVIEGKDTSLTARAMSMQKMHKAYPVTGGLCTASATQLEGTVVHDVYSGTESDGDIVIGHPTGKMKFVVDIEDSGDAVVFHKTATARTARRLMEGNAYVSKEIFWQSPVGEEHQSQQKTLA
ncbi:2-methylaconitate cis-trans isomerase PrpF family protein [Salinicoccus halitifaciens]|uniref:2-methylaconitate cis-trans-isomerase PrpF n=1 Tax=Salinicoccus halitifaciens TaxID=1073415 RepID=A0ABV2E7Y7_9STAP|nr:PrpF domain-containing protein [Salinicoccus halitifaciens]MCD2136433.1 3-methylitaconate isomerase [Salinicoccus halitifaciens]